jgi:sulfur carrier protein ThiS
MTFVYFLLVERWMGQMVQGKYLSKGIVSRMRPMSRTTLKIEVLSNGRTAEYELPKDSTVEDLLLKLNCHPDAYIITKDSKPIPITRKIEDGDKVKLIKVASGG